MCAAQSKCYLQVRPACEEGGLGTAGVPEGHAGTWGICRCVCAYEPRDGCVRAPALATSRCLSPDPSSFQVTKLRRRTQFWREKQRSSTAEYLKRSNTLKRKNEEKLEIPQLLPSSQLPSAALCLSVLWGQSGTYPATVSSPSDSPGPSWRKGDRPLWEHSRKATLTQAAWESNTILSISHMDVESLTAHLTLVT